MWCRCPCVSPGIPWWFCLQWQWWLQQSQYAGSVWPLWEMFRELNFRRMSDFLHIVFWICHLRIWFHKMLGFTNAYPGAMKACAHNLLGPPAYWVGPGCGCSWHFEFGQIAPVNAFARPHADLAHGKNIKAQKLEWSIVIIICVKQQNHLLGSINSASQLTALEGGTWHMHTASAEAHRWWIEVGMRWPNGCQPQKRWNRGLF